MNILYYGDNLKILRDYIEDESVDLVYLDPPFKATAITMCCCGNESSTDSESQITAFEDTWHWNLAAEQTYSELIDEPDQVGRSDRILPRVHQDARAAQHDGENPSTSVLPLPESLPFRHPTANRRFVARF